MYKTITEIKAANKALGHFWFDQPCRTETPILGGYYWVESRPRDDDPGRRWYAPVKADDEGMVFWVDTNANRLDTLDAARAVIDEILK